MQHSTVPPPPLQKKEICISTYDPLYERAWQPLCRVNLTGFTMPTSGKNREFLSIPKKRLKTSFKTGVVQISLAAQKI